MLGIVKEQKIQCTGMTLEMPGLCIFSTELGNRLEQMHCVCYIGSYFLWLVNYYKSIPKLNCEGLTP